MRRALYISILSAFMFAAYATSVTGLGQNYPNPAKGKTYVEVTFQSPTAVLTIYNVLGVKMEEKLLDHSGTFEINVTNYPEGVYLYTLDADGEKVTKRMTVVRK